jgi:trigger factor
MAKHHPEPRLEVRVTEVSPVVRSVEVEVDAESVSHAFDDAYRVLSARVAVRGFRPGKTPRSVLQKLYGASVAEDVQRVLLETTLARALDRAGVEAVTMPAIDAGAPVDGQAFPYTARVEIKPAIALGEIRGLPGRRPRVQVGDEDVARELEGLRQRQARLVEEPEGTPIATGHVVGLDYEGRVDGTPIEGARARDARVEIGSGGLPPGFEAGLIGARAGQDLEIPVEFPADDPRPALAGRSARFAVHVSSVQRREVPALDDELAKDLGDEFESLEQLRRRIRADLEAARTREAQGALERSVMDALIERHPFDVPPGLVERTLERRLAMAHRELERAVAHDALHRQLARWQEEWRPAAEREVREALLLEAVAAREALHVEDAEVDARIDALAHERGGDAKKLRRQYREAEMIEPLRGQMLDEKALALLVREAKVEETTGS